MPSLNKVFLLGNLTRDPELRFTPSGASVCEFSIAVNREWGGKDGGEKKKEVGFFDCVAWARTAEVVAQYLKKGSPAMVEGRLTQDRWQDPQGQSRSKVKITVENVQFLGSKPGAASRVPAEADSGEEDPFA